MQDAMWFLMQWAAARLKEPSTWAGVGLFLTAHLGNFAWLASPDVVQYGLMFAASVLAVILAEHKAVPPTAVVGAAPAAAKSLLMLCMLLPLATLLGACQLPAGVGPALNTAVTDLGVIVNAGAAIECRKLTSKKAVIGVKACKTIAGDVVSLGQAAAQGALPPAAAAAVPTGSGTAAKTAN